MPIHDTIDPEQLQDAIESPNKNKSDIDSDNLDKPGSKKVNNSKLASDVIPENNNKANPGEDISTHKDHNIKDSDDIDFIERGSDGIGFDQDKDRTEISFPSVLKRLRTRMAVLDELTGI